MLGLGSSPVEGGTLVYQFLNDRLRARLQLFEREGRVEVLASNHTPARVFVGEERPLVRGVETNVVVAGAAGTATSIGPITEIRDVGNTRVIMPKINADGTVTLLLSQDSSSINPSSATIPVATAGGGIREFPIDTVETATLNGTVVAKDDLTVAVGGLIPTEVVGMVEKVPVLGDLPVLDLFFKKEMEDRTKRELILLITPHVLTSPAEGQAATRQRLEGLSHHHYFETGDDALEPPVNEQEEVEWIRP